jgi:hypothetical protein
VDLGCVKYQAPVSFLLCPCSLFPSAEAAPSDCHPEEGLTLLQEACLADCPNILCKLQVQPYCIPSCVYFLPLQVRPGLLEDWWP